MDKKEKKEGMFQKIFRFAGEKKKEYIIAVFLAFIGVVFSLLPYFFIGKMVNALIAGNHNFKFYALYLGFTLISWILRATFHSFSTKRSHTATFEVLGNIRKEIAKKLLRVPLGDVINIPSGSLKNIICERVDSMETTLAHIIPEFTANIAAPLIIFIALLFISWKLALASLITVPIGFIGMAAMMKNAQADFQLCMDKTKVLNDTAVEYINGIEVIKAFGKTDSSYKKFEAAAHDGAYCYIDWMKRSMPFYVPSLAITPATLLGVLPIGGIMYLRGDITANAFIMVIILAMSLLTPLITVMSYNDDLSKCNIIFGEVTDILDMPEMNRPEKSTEKPSDNGIEFSDVHFGYSKEKEILHGISLKMNAGSVNALVGPSGSGKSTIARLIASLWDVGSGTVKIGGADVKNISFEDYSRLVAYVSQDNYLFNQSVMENIRMGNPKASDEDVIKTAKECGCNEFIEKLENGYDTIVGDSGGHLSGGERQRISIARAMLKNAPILIMDEATAYTDPENEALIQYSLSKIIKGKTLIVIAHRLSTITDADDIFVIENGNVNSHGTHDELLETSSLYKKMWTAHISARDSAEENEQEAE